MTKHTKGPWFTDDKQSGDLFRYVMHGESDSFGYVCRVSVNGHASAEAAEADARLIAAAPELLEALNRLVIACEVGIDLGAVAEARAAIAKATGEQA